ncbi:hypothetical protein V7127_25755, partial [Bacillus sp. JJ1773]|uniref:hypothetical protein n=1 Tax=Bacillus sp. JJ1773 TaxID=3122965 RepID=UPI002FFFEA9F
NYGIINIRNTKGPIGNIHKSLYTLSGFDKESINSVLNWPLTIENEQLLERLLRPITDSRYTKDNSLSFHFMRYKFTFCPICINNQYHSTLHQFYFIQKCPFHLIPLMNQCPSCQRSIPYIFDDSLFQSHFVCTCGYMFAQVNRRIEQNMIKTFKDKDLTKWFYSSMSYRERLINIIILEELSMGNDYQEENFNISLSDLFSFLNNSTPIITTKQLINSESKKQIFKLKKRLRLEYWNNPLLKKPARGELDYQCNQIFNSIARHLRNGILKKHIPCIKQYTRYNGELSDEEKCSFAIAYSHWRQRLQDFRSIEDVDNYGTTPFFRNHYSRYKFPLWNGKRLINNIIEDINQLDEFDSKRVALNWMVLRFVAELILADFKRNLIIAANHRVNNDNDNYLQSFDFVAKVIVEPSTTFSNKYKMYLDNQHSIDFFCNDLNISCPNNSVKKRRVPKTQYKKKSPMQEVIKNGRS